MTWLVHSEFTPVNLSQVASLKREGPQKIVFAFADTKHAEWEFKDEDKRNEFYVRITQILIQQEGSIVLG